MKCKLKNGLIVEWNGAGNSTARVVNTNHYEFDGKFTWEERESLILLLNGGGGAYGMGYDIDKVLINGRWRRFTKKRNRK